MEYNSYYKPRCPRREECTLWHNAEKQIAEGTTFLEVVNPEVMATAGGYDHCPEFHQWVLRRYARGMQWHYGVLTGDAEVAIHRTLEEHFGRSLIGRAEGRRGHLTRGSGVYPERFCRGRRGCGAGIPCF